MAQKSKVWYLENFNFFCELEMVQRTFICQNTVMKTLKKGEAVYPKRPRHQRLFSKGRKDPDLKIQPKGGGISVCHS